MRKRFGAIHSDNVEDFIEIAQKSWEKDLIFYDDKINKNVREYESKLEDYETNTSHNIEDERESYNQNIIVIDNRSNIGLRSVKQYCQNESDGDDEKEQLKYFFKLLQNNSLAIDCHQHFWIQNLDYTKFPRLMDVYYKSASVIIFLYDRDNEEHFTYIQNIIEKLNKCIPIYKVCTNNQRAKSSNNLIEENQLQIINVKNIQEALQRISLI